MNYYTKLNKKLNAKLRKEKAERVRAEKAEAKRRKHEQALALKRMKRQGILESEKKKYTETRERRLKKLGLFQGKEKREGGFTFHLSKKGYRRKKKGGLFSSPSKPVTYSYSTKKRKKKHGAVRRFFLGNL